MTEEKEVSWSELLEKIREKEKHSNSVSATDINFYDLASKFTMEDFQEFCKAFIEVETKRRVAEMEKEKK